jgi:hypothetical protein
LLSHTSGLPEFVDDSRFLAPYVRGNLGHAWTPEQMVAFATSGPPAFAPGARYSYSSGHESAWRAFTQAITTRCGRAWGRGGASPGHYQLPISSPDGSRQAVLLVNTEEALQSPAAFKQIYDVLATAYCRGVGRVA